MHLDVGTDEASENSLEVACPVRILHGLKDQTVTHVKSVKLMKAMASKDIELILRKAGDHLMEQPEDLSLMAYVLDTLIENCTQ